MTLELWLERDGQLVFHDEFCHVEPLQKSGPDAAVVALSRGLNQIIEGVVGQMRSLDLFATAYQEQHAALLAQPLR